MYPCVSGHEIVGNVVRVGSQAEGDLKIGDVVGVGAQSDACLNRDGPCYECSNGLESYCKGFVQTISDTSRCGAPVYGGHALYHRCPSHFVVKIPQGLAPELAAPMLCGGITVFAPLKHYGAGPGKKIAIHGIGGLGHFAVLFARAMGCEEIVGISRKASKKEDALSLGCDEYIATEEAGWAEKHAGRFDLIISTASGSGVSTY